MPDTDRIKWNQKYTDAAAENGFSQPSAVLTNLAPWLPTPGRALDVAGGAGRHAIWLARQGWDATIADVSEVGLELARRRAAESGVRIATQLVDLEEQSFPAGPWDLVLSFHFLWRSLYAAAAQTLSPRGRLVVVQPTQTNLARHARPPAPYLLNDGELMELVKGLGLRVVFHREGWSEEGRHEAVVVAERK